MLPQKIYGIIGHPLGHTMSPCLHNWAFREKKVPAVYMKWETPPGNLTDFIIAVRTLPISGVSVTIPHKQAVREFLDDMTFRAKAVGAVNTLFWKNGRLWGDNTDVLGCIAPLSSRDHLPESALVLGAGGAARAMVAGLKDLGINEIFISNRTLFKAETIAHDFTVRTLEWEQRLYTDVQLIINTTPLGMQGENEHTSPMEGYAFRAGQIAYDLVYNPLHTKFLQDAEQAGCDTITGLEMFVGQGLAQFELWTGDRFDTAKATELLKREMASRA